MTDTGIKQRIDAIRLTLPSEVRLVAVSKFHPAELIDEAYRCGQRDFGESRTQELSLKAESLPEDIRWHFIGHLQTNKVRPTVKYAWMIQSVDSERLLAAIDREAAAQGKQMRVLMQVHVAQEETKFGFTPDELEAFFAEKRYAQFKSVRFCGLMAMASNTDDVERIKADFNRVAEMHSQIRAVAPDLTEFEILSMGMSDDYALAVECGSNMVRIGSTIFGNRQY